MKEHIQQLLPAYLDKTLDQKERAEVEHHLETCDVCRKELEALRVLFQAFETEKKAEVPDRVRTNFYAMLEEEKTKNASVLSLPNSGTKTRGIGFANMFKVAASIALLIGAFLLGKYQKGQESNALLAQVAHENLAIKQTAMLSLMENKSASKRIQGVEYIEAFEEPDEAIVKALADRVLYDENTNVRLTAVTALQQFRTSEIVKNTFIEALGVEKDPGIQILIIQTLVNLQEKKAVKPMKELLENEETQPFIKTQIQQALPQII
ncbi:zf-HC2 domain-containing protein [Spongiimicrobium salis]|uniref:zf-HC2 domain-containing protein n=1 Tax=Spongiimicrobium salis TaxID=1667022 RepID=UPI00374D1CA2